MQSTYDTANKRSLWVRNILQSLHRATGREHESASYNEQPLPWFEHTIHAGYKHLSFKSNYKLGSDEKKRYVTSTKELTGSLAQFYWFNYAVAVPEELRKGYWRQREEQWAVLANHWWNPHRKHPSWDLEGICKITDAKGEENSNSEGSPWGMWVCSAGHWCV